MCPVSKSFTQRILQQDETLWEKGNVCMAEVENLFLKGQIVNIFDFEPSTISVTTTHLCHCCVKAAIDNMKMSGHGWIQFTCSSLLTPDL